MQDITDWIPAISTTSLLAAAVWLLRSSISTRLTQSVKSEFDTKLAVLKSDLKSKETQIEALRSGALSGLISRQSKLYEKQVEAIELLWESKTELDRAKAICASMSILKFEASAQEAAVNPQFRRMFEVMGSGLTIQDLKLGSASKARPFISQLAWAYYSAYEAIIMLSMTKLELLRKGIETPEKYINLDGPGNLIKLVLPHKSNYIDQNGSSSHHYLLDEIESLLLSELRNIQKGNEADKENAERSAAILRESEKLKSGLSGESE